MYLKFSVGTNKIKKTVFFFSIVCLCLRDQERTPCKEGAWQRWRAFIFGIDTLKQRKRHFYLTKHQFYVFLEPDKSVQI